MKTIKMICMPYLFLFILILNADLFSQSLGEKIYTQSCRACHSIGEGKLAGPDLANIHLERDENWLIRFIQSSQSMIKAGDSLAVAIFNEYNQVIMPDQQFKPNEIKSVIEYIASVSPDPNDPDKKSPAQIFNASLVTDLDINRGKKIFDGNARLTNGGPSCITCHNVSNSATISGGRLAVDLTNAFSRLSAAGLDGIIKNPPFPAMIDAYSEKPLTEEEVKALVAFLYDSDTKEAYQAGVLQADLVLIIGVFVGLNLMLAIFFLMWRSVKKYSTYNS